MHFVQVKPIDWAGQGSPIPATSRMTSGRLLFRNPPVPHPVLVNFTAGLFPAALLADWLGRLLRRRSLLAAGWWMLLFAAVITPFTALAGWLWYRHVGDMGHVQMRVHPWAGSHLTVLLATLAVWRGRFQARDQEPSRKYLISSTAVLLGLIFQGHLGASRTRLKRSQ